MAAEHCKKSPLTGGFGGISRSAVTTSCATTNVQYRMETPVQPERVRGNPPFWKRAVSIEMTIIPPPRGDRAAGCRAETRSQRIVKGTRPALPPFTTGRRRTAGTFVGRPGAAPTRKDKAMNWDQIESKWSAMTKRVRVDWGGETGQERQTAGSNREIVTAEVVMLRETGSEGAAPERTVRV